MFTHGICNTVNNMHINLLYGSQFKGLEDKNHKVNISAAIIIVLTPK